MILDRLVLAGLTWTARAAVTALRTDRSRPAGSGGRRDDAAAEPVTEVVRLRKKISTEARLPQQREAAARTDVPPVESFELVGPDAEFVHALQPDDFPS